MSYRNVINSLLLIIFSVFLYGCPSEKDRQARRDNAFDLSGKYEPLANSIAEISFEITNEGGKKYDILLTLTRSKSSITKAEKDFLLRLKRDYNIASDKMFEPPTQIIFGKNTEQQSLIVSLIPSAEKWTHEDNFSDDLGKTSQFDLCADLLFDYPINTRNSRKEEKLAIFYCLSGVVKKESKDIIKGKFFIRVSHSYINNDSGNQDSIEGPEPLEFRYTARKLR